MAESNELTEAQMAVAGKVGSWYVKMMTRDMSSALEQVVRANVSTPEDGEMGMEMMEAMIDVVLPYLTTPLSIYCAVHAANGLDETACRKAIWDDLRATIARRDAAERSGGTPPKPDPVS